MKAKYDSADPVESFKAMVRELVKGYEFDVKGLILNDGTIEPLPREASVVGKVVEVSITKYLKSRFLSADLHGLEFIPASSDRTYPDFSFYGSMLGDKTFAVDLKCARRSSSTRTKSAITIGTFDAQYFRVPQIKAPNIMRPYGSYSAHLAVIALYDYVGATVRNVELLVVEKWRVATKKRSSGTRCYIAAPSEIARLRAEGGDFASEEEFNAFWRAQPIKESKRARYEKLRQSDS